MQCQREGLVPTTYNRVMLGRGSQHASEGFAGGFIGADFDIKEDLTYKLPEEWRDFNKEFIPVLIAADPEKSKIGAGLFCGQLWTVAKGLVKGDVVLCPDGTGVYHVGRIVSDYYYAPGEVLPHRRKVEWFSTIKRVDMSVALKHSTGSIGTTCNITSHAEELENLIEGASRGGSSLVSTDPDVEDPSTFALEAHLEDFLVNNWDQTLLGKDYDIYAEEGEVIGKQYLTDAGIIDILAVSKDGKRLLVVELKRGRTSDVVVGQTLRYMGFVEEELATDSQTVEGVIIGLEDDKKLRWALKPVPSIKSYRYRIDFKLLAN
jgi:restriction system protein